jgi:uncharacterized membrane protein (DUF4010 family)
MNARRVLYAYFGMTALYGALAGYFASFDASPPRVIEFILTLVSVVLVYLWYYFDAEERKYQRTALLGGAVILLSIFAVPYYLVRSRPRGARFKAVGLFLGAVLLSFLVILLAGLPFMFMRP